MSKNLRTFLLSMLVIVLAASSAMAATETITFKWTGVNGNYWGHASNWLAVDSSDKRISYDKVKDEIVALKDGIEFYPGKVESKAGATTSYDVRVLISKDASIVMYQGGNAVGGIVNVKSIDILGTSANNTAKVTIDMGSDSWFETAPSITVANQFSGLTINGSHNPAFKITGSTKWEGISADLALYMPVLFVSDSADLSLDVSNASLTIGNATLLGASAKRKTHITIDQEKSSPVAKLVFDVAYEGKSGAEGSTFDTMLINRANRIDVLKDVVLDVWSQDVFEAVGTDSFDKGFAKGGSAKLTLRKLADRYGRKGHPVVSTDKFSVLEGTLAFVGEGNAPLGKYTKEVKFNVAKGAVLDLGKKTISSDKRVTLVADGEVLFHEGAVDVNDTYTGGPLKLSADVSIDVHSTGTISFYGSQAIHYVKGTGSIKLADSSVSEAILILTGTSNDIKNFTGTIESLDVGIVTSWDVIPFLTKGYGDISQLYVFGPDGSLTLDAAKLAKVESLDISNTVVYLRSNIPGSTTFTQLNNIDVGKLKISGDITLGEVKVDGTKDAEHVGTIEFLSKDAKLTVNKITLHANADKDFKADTKAKTNENVYVNVYGVDIIGPGVFAPKAIENGTTDSNIKVGTEDSVLVGDKATLELKGGVKFPFYNSLLLKTSSIDVENGTEIPGNFVVDGSSRIRVSLTDKNARAFETSKDIENAAIVVGGIFKLSGDTGLSVDITDIADTERFLGIMYGVVGYPSFDIGGKSVVSVDVDIIGDYAINNSIALGLDNNGLYAQLVKWLIKPEVGQWKFTAGDPELEFGNASKQFQAEISYDVPGDIDPETVVNYLIPTITLWHKGRQATPVLTLNTPRQNIRSAVTGENLAFLMLSRDLTAHKLILSGTSYKTALDLRINLRWDKTSRVALAAYNNATITYSEGGKLGTGHQHNGPVKVEDLVDLVAAERPLKNSDRVDPVVSKDIYLDPDVLITSPVIINAGDESAKFEFIISGMNETVTNNAALPVLENGVYVWKNTAVDKNKPYTITTDDGTITVTNVKILVEGKEIPMDSVDITPSGNGVLVSIPAVLLGESSSTPKAVAVTGETDDGKTVHITEQHVTVNPAINYQEGTVNEGEKSVAFENGGSSANHVVADVPLTGTISYDVSSTPAGLVWNNEGGVIAYTLNPNIATGTYDMTVRAFNENYEGYIYTFQIVVTAPVVFGVNVEVLYSDTYAGTNYVAYATADNAPEGEIQWSIETEAEWLKTAMSGDTFVIFGQLPAYTGNVDDYEYTVIASVGAEVARSAQTVSVAEDNAETTVTTLSEAAGTMVYSGDLSINSADKNYEVVISFTEGYYNYMNPEDFNLPYWLEATQTLNGDGDVIGYTIAFKQGAKVAEGATGVIRFADPDTQDIISVPVTFVDDTTEPVVPPVDFTLEVTGNTTLSVKLNDVDTSITIASRDAVGPVTYTVDADWVTVNETTGVVTVAPTDSALAGTTQTVTIKATDVGHGAGKSEDVLPLTITVIPVAGPVSHDFKLSVTGSTTLSVALNETDTSVTLTPSNVDGTVSYTPSVSWVTVNETTGVVTVAPTDANLVGTTQTVTIKATDVGHQNGNGEAEITLNITVTAKSGGDDFRLSVNPNYANGVTVDISAGTLSFDAAAAVRAVNNQGTVSYTVASSNAEGLKVELSGGTVTLTPLKAGNYTVTVTGTDAATNKTATASINVEVTGGGTVGSSGGGCDTGFGALALVFAAPLFLRRRRS